jgi:hypothetical protein
MTTHPLPPAVSLGAVNVESRDPAALAQFWAAALGSTVEASTPETAFVPARGAGGFAMFFQPGGGTAPRKQSQAQHLDLTVPWGTRVSEVARFVALGATHQWDVLDEVPWVQWSTLTDPEGNLFCIAEHPPTAA